MVNKSDAAQVYPRLNKTFVLLYYLTHEPHFSDPHIPHGKPVTFSVNMNIFYKKHTRMANEIINRYLLHKHNFVQKLFFSN